MTTAGSKRWWRHGSLQLPIGGIVVAIVMHAQPFAREPAAVKDPHLQESIPAQVLGWTSRDLPLGANEFVSGEVEKILNLDDWVNREYQRDGIQFGVYIGYWGAGKMPTQLVASHTPDRCWTENGWNCVDMRFKERRSFDGNALLPAEWRLFEVPGRSYQTHVLYWHLVDAEVYDYGQRFNAIPHPLRWWRDVMHQALQGKREQYFIRLTSSVPFQQLWEDVGFAEVLDGVARLGLVAPPSAVEKEGS